MNRYVFFCPTGAFGGLELQMVRYAADALEHGDAAVLVVEPGSKMESYARELGVPTETISQLVDYVDVFAAYKLRRIFARIRPDSCIVGITRHLSIAILAKHLSRIKPKIVLFQQMISGLRKVDLFHNWVYRNVDAAIVPTVLMEDMLSASTILPKKKIHVIPYGIHLREVAGEKFDPLAERATFGIAAGKFVIGHTARFEALKDQETAIRAFVMARVPNSMLVLAGEGDPEYRARMQQLVSDLGISDSVRFLPFTSRFGALLACFDIYIMTSLCETFSLALLQAMAAGKPVIGTNSGGTPEAIVHEQSGLLFEPTDAETLALHLRRLAEDPAFAKRIAQEGKENAWRRYDSNVQYENFFRAASGGLEAAE